MANEMDRVVPLDDLDDFRVAEGDPDVRGWEVIASDGRKIGEVDELLIDTVAMKVRYLDVDLDSALMQGTDARHVLIPIGYARLDEADDRIFVDEVDSARLAALPEYSHDLTRDYESILRQNLDSGYVLDTEAKTDYYAHDHYNDERFYGARRAQATDTTPGPGGAAGLRRDEPEVGPETDTRLRREE